MPSGSGCPRMTKVRVRLLRSWNTRAGLRHPPAEIKVSAKQARAMAQTVPPYAEIVEDEPEEPAVDATHPALTLAAEAGLDLAGYAGQGSGADGRITKADVEGWVRGE